MNKTLLLVDDEPYILQSLKRLFSNEGYCVLTANNGLEGLALFNTNTIHILISDQRMPFITGSEFLKRVKSLYPETICMIISAFTDFDVVKDAINEGNIYKFISKPWNNELLRQYVCDAFEIVHSKKNKQKLSLSIYNDTLTGLHNRFYLYESLWEIISKIEKDHEILVIIYLDVDRLSHINANLGQNNGDQVLKLVATRLKQFIQNEDHIARIGNDEFVVLVSDQKESFDLLSFMHLFCSMLKEPFNIEGTTLYITFSVGVNVYPEQGDSIDNLINHACMAAAACKNLGGDQYKLHEPNMRKIEQAQFFLESDLHHALENNEFVIHYQPIYVSKQNNTYEIASVEALIRWQHPKYGLLPPGKFVHLCEKTSLIILIGDWVLKTACQQLITWREQGYTSLRVSVNLSVRQFNHPCLLNSIVDILDKTQLPPNCLELEITESLIMHDIERVIPLLNSLQSLGIHLSLDDFGTGYSSLSYLKTLPFSVLKIDRSFIKDISITINAKILVDAIIAMGKSLNLKIIAEGVETKEQLDLLKEKQCDFIQGFLFSKPLQKEELTKLLKLGSCQL